MMFLEIASWWLAMFALTVPLGLLLLLALPGGSTNEIALLGAMLAGAVAIMFAARPERDPT